MDLPPSSSRKGMPPHQDVGLVTGSYGTRCNAELARGVLDFDPYTAYLSGGES